MSTYVNYFSDKHNIYLSHTWRSTKKSNVPCTECRWYLIECKSIDRLTAATAFVTLKTQTFDNNIGIRIRQYFSRYWIASPCLNFRLFNHLRRRWFFTFPQKTLICKYTFCTCYIACTWSVPLHNWHTVSLSHILLINYLPLE